MFKLQRRVRPESERQDEEPDRFGWNLIGMFDHRGGIGTAAQANAKALRKILEKTRSIAFPGNHYTSPVDVPAIHGNNYLHFNPSCVNIMHMRDVDWFRNGINVGYWAWETSKAPEKWKDYEQFMQQIWVPTNFVREAILRIGFEQPIFVIPHAIEPQLPHLFPRPENPITIFVQFDGQSRWARKRPDLSIAAIALAASRTNEKIRLLIKSHNKGTAQIAVPEYENVKVRVIDQWMDESAMSRLFDTVDILVSLNRGEGFGLPMVEAMARGMAVVATNYGGSLDYLRQDNSYPVEIKCEEDAKLGGDGYFKSGKWALPDVSHAAEQIEKAIGDIRSNKIHKISAAARRMADEFSFEQMTRKMKQALAKL